MDTQKKLLIVIIVLLSLGWIGSSWHRPAEAASPKSLFKQLALSKEQIVQLRAKRHDDRPMMREQFGQFELAHRELVAEIAKDDPDEQKIKAIKQRLLQFEQQRIDFMVQSLLDMKSVLTKEQFEKLRKLKTLKPLGPEGGRHHYWQGKTHSK